MYKIILTLFFVLGGTSMLSAAPDNTHSRFYDMSGSTIDGEILRPSHQLVQSLGPIKFQRLLRLKRNLMGDHLRRTTRYRTFK
jgi:hypothetical protein